MITATILLLAALTPATAVMATAADHAGGVQLEMTARETTLAPWGVWAEYRTGDGHVTASAGPSVRPLRWLTVRGGVSAYGDVVAAAGGASLYIAGWPSVTAGYDWAADSAVVGLGWSWR